MRIHFYKYQATGNDFVIIDNTSLGLKLKIEQVKKICDRKFGIGADGLMLLEKHPSAEFNLIYYNSDGSQSLCGNGSRAAVHMASALGLISSATTFNAYDGMHDAWKLPDERIRLRMNDVTTITNPHRDFFINTGSPHYVRFVDDVHHYPVFDDGKKIRYSSDFEPAGTNVNFVQLLPDSSIFVRTYERGVENETLSCGTGVVASAIAASLRGLTSPVKVKTLGGELEVEFKTSLSGTFHEIFLVGPAKLVFEGDLEL